MQSLRRYISALLLLVVISIGGLPLLQHYLHCPCSSHCVDHSISDRDHHHHCTADGECENHRSSLDRHCVVGRGVDVVDEFVVSSPTTIQSVMFVLAMLVVAIAYIVEVKRDSCIDNWRSYGLYRGFDPECEQLRAPPALA